MAAGVLATGNNLRSALLTDTSVACADSITAISNSKGLVYSSSVVGCGLATRSRLKMARRFSAFMVLGSCVFIGAFFFQAGGVDCCLNDGFFACLFGLLFRCLAAFGFYLAQFRGGLGSKPGLVFLF